MTCEQCTFLQEQGGVSSQISSLDIPPRLQLNGNTIPVKSSENDVQKDGFPSWLCGKETSETLIRPTTKDEWIASMRGSLVKILVSLENKPVLGKAHARGFTEKSCVSLAQLDPSTSSWKMSPLLKATVLNKLSKTWPSWGMTVDGCAYEHPMSGHRITEIDGFVWPTPNSRDWKDSGGSQGNRKSPNLGTRVHWPTPRTMGMCGGSGAWALLKKNTSIEEARLMGAGNGGKLNPTWVEWLMGWPIEYTVSKQLETVKSPSKSQQRLPSWLRSK